MADLEDAEDAIAQQEAWGVTLTDVAVKRIAKAVRVLRTAVVSHGNRLTAAETRLTALEAGAGLPTAPAAPEPEPEPPPE